MTFNNPTYEKINSIELKKKKNTQDMIHYTKLNLIMQI